MYFLLNTTEKRKLGKGFLVPEFRHPNRYTSLPYGLKTSLHLALHVLAAFAAESFQLSKTKT